LSCISNENWPLLNPRGLNASSKRRAIERLARWTRRQTQLFPIIWAVSYDGADMASPYLDMHV
jgi:hypothetical protein